MKITFSNIENVESKAKDADVFLCLAEANRHPANTKPFEKNWASKWFYEYQLNDRHIDNRYKHVEFQDIRILAKFLDAILLKEKKEGKEQWLHINCLAGFSRSAAIAIFALMKNQTEPPTLKDYQKYYGEVVEGEHRLIKYPTCPNDEICKYVRAYFNLEVIDREFDGET